MNKLSSSERRRLALENASYGSRLVKIPSWHWPEGAREVRPQPLEVWRSFDFLLSVYAESDGVERLSISSTRYLHGTWQDGITWDQLQRLKAECGRGEKWAVEVYPADASLVNVANMRHLWVLPTPPNVGWR